VFRSVSSQALATVSENVPMRQSFQKDGERGASQHPPLSDYEPAYSISTARTLLPVREPSLARSSSTLAVPANEE
jgi:hypothetical protein